MKSRLMLTLCAVLAAGLVLAAPSIAHTLKISRAASANKTFAKLLCNAVTEEGDEGSACATSRPGGCHRLSEHRVRCDFFLTLDFEDGSRARCLNVIDWSIRGRSASLHPNYRGIRSCLTLRPPKVEEPAP